MILSAEELTIAAGRLAATLGWSHLFATRRAALPGHVDLDNPFGAGVDPRFPAANPSTWGSLPTVVPEAPMKKIGVIGSGEVGRELMAKAAAMYDQIQKLGGYEIVMDGTWSGRADKYPSPPTSSSIFLSRSFCCSVMTSIASRAMTPAQAVIIVGVFEFLGPLLGGTAVGFLIAWGLGLEGALRGVVVLIRVIQGRSPV